MKSLKFFFALFAIVLTLSANSQSVSGNLYYSTGNTRIIGADLLVTYPSNFVIGVGGSHASKTFFTSEKRNGNDYTDNCNNLASNFPKLNLPENAPRIRETFIENRGTVTTLLGYSFKKSTTILSEFGIGLQQEIKLATTGNPSILTAHGSNYWESKTVGPKFLYGGVLTQNINGRFGLLVGYNNIQKFKFGINYRITPTKMFKW